MESIKTRKIIAPSIRGEEGFNALARKVHEKGARRIAELVELQGKYVELVGAESEDVRKKLDAESERLERVLAKMVEFKERKMRWEGLTPSELRLFVMADSSVHEEDEVYRANPEPEIRKKILTRKLDEDEYMSLLYRDVFAETKPAGGIEVRNWRAGAIVPAGQELAEPVQDIADQTERRETGAARVEEKSIAPVADEALVVAVFRNSLTGRASHISASVGAPTSEIRSYLARYSDREIGLMFHVCEDFALNPAKLVALDIILRDGCVPRESIVLTTDKPGAVTGQDINTRLDRAIRIAVCGKRITESMEAAFRHQYGIAFAKRMERHTKKLAALRAKIRAEEGIGNEEKAQRRYEEESKRIKLPENRVEELLPGITTRHLARISELLCHEPAAVEDFTEFFESEFDLTPSERDKSSRSSKVSQIAEYRGISRSKAQSLLNEEDKDKRLDGFNPTGERHYRVLTGVLRQFIEEKCAVLDIDEGAKLFPQVRKSVEIGMKEATEAGELVF